MKDVALGYVSLFSGGGFGDAGIVYGAGIPLLACCELVEERAAVLRRMFPSSRVHSGDIWSLGHDVVRSVRDKIGPGRRPWLVVMSPPCQGMSSNGRGRIDVGVERGTRPGDDPRNRLLLPALSVIDELQPEWVVVENVKNMQHTSVQNEQGEPENLLCLLRRRLRGYRVETQILDAADYGVPQRRQRLITVCSRMRHAGKYHPPPTHGVLTSVPHVSLREATCHLPVLDALHHRQDKHDGLHSVPRWTPAQHFCMLHTPEGQTAFDNTTCIECGFKNTNLNVVHCGHCGTGLPRPTVTETVWNCSTCGAVTSDSCATCEGGHARSADARLYSRKRLVRAFKTSYRRMHADRPAGTLTTNSGVISSDIKGHPTQHRVLSVREVLIASSMSPLSTQKTPWTEAENVVASLPHRLIRTLAGESIPPRLLATLVMHLAAVEDHAVCYAAKKEGDEGAAGSN